ncbi:hypothetical protein [Edaphobacter bradus]|uniref:hypothetical protein n=1 Tax=Edaphobacter bradus TaxID=2259016 RepID=UPI0021E052C8|nr:hypothetical protein [Edaphobacter bradus]
MTEMTRSAVMGMQGVSEKTRSLLTKLNLCYAGVAALALVNLYLLAHMAFAWRAAQGQDEAALAQQRVAMQAAEIARRPLEGLDEKLKLANEDADRFYQRRLPFAYSQVAGELGMLAKKQDVKLTRVQYAESPLLEHSAGELTEVRMDASLSGDYRALVLFVNGLERDKTFFLINGVALTGQQSGTVGLRLKLTTFLRPATAKESSEKSVLQPTADDSASGGEPR